MATLKFYKVSEAAVIPTKAHSSDAGYDLTIVSVYKEIAQNLVLYDTGIKVEPSEGLYTEIYARSSLMKIGYMLANNVGIIDNSYRGNILIALYKFDTTKPNIELPCRVAQLIPRLSVNVDVIVEDVKNITETKRGEGGFGSTN